MIEIINEAYNKLNTQYINEWLYPSPQHRKRVVADLINELKDLVTVDSFTVKCDEENNPPNIVDAGCVVARISWRDNEIRLYESFKYCNLIFGCEMNINSIRYLVDGYFAG